MKILFVHLVSDYSSLGIEYISASLKRAGHETDLILNYSEEKYFANRLYERVNAFKPDFICFSVVTFDYLWASGVAKFLREITSAKIVFGGIHPTSCPEEVIRHPFIDYIVIGEGDEAIIDLVEAPDRKNIQNVWTNKGGEITKNSVRPLLQDLDMLPFPDKELFYKEAPYLNKIYFIISGKGCPFSCSYCFNSSLKKIYNSKCWVRKRSVDNMIEELKTMKEKYNFRQVSFFDDCFTNDIAWFRDFAAKYKKEINLPFRAITHPMFVNEESATLLKDAGCIKIQVGAQSPIQKIREDICNRFTPNDVLIKAVKILKSKGMIVSIDHIFGLPTEKIEDYEQGLDFYIDLKPNWYFTFWLQYYPNTGIVEIAKREKIITDDDVRKVSEGRISFGTSAVKKEMLCISRFMHFIPFMPRALSKYLLRTKLYSKLFRFDFTSHLAGLIPHLYSRKLFMALFYEADKIIRRKIALKKVERAGSQIEIPEELKHWNSTIIFKSYSNFDNENLKEELK